jgi:hypothetical protein
MLGDEEDLEQNEMTVGKLNLIKYDSITPGMEAVTKIRYKDKGTLSNLYPSELYKQGMPCLYGFMKMQRALPRAKVLYFMRATT